MATQVEVCNDALTELGASPIAAITENSKAAIRLRQVWDAARDALLARHRWGFARAQVALAVVSGVTVSGWDYVYALPSACLVARSIYQADEAADPIPFTLATSANSDARYVLTNEEGAELVYTARVTTVTLWPPGFCRAMALELAARVCMPLTADAQLKATMVQLAERAFQLAAAEDANQQIHDPKRDPDWIRGR